MYYEEKVINGVLHWRGHPDDNWTPCTPQELTAKLEGKAAALRAVREAPVAEVHGSMATEAPWLACKAEDPAAVYALHGQRVRLVPVGDDPIDASDNADYIEHCADRLERCGLPTTAGALRVIAHEHRALAQQPAADTYNRRLKAQLEQEWANLQDLKRAYQTQQPAAVAPVEAVEEALQRWLDWCNEHNEEPEARSGARIAIEALVQQPAAVDGVWIRLCGSQGEPAGTMTVTAGLRDGSEVVLIRDTGNEIDHSVNLAAALAGQQGGAK